MSDSTKVTVSFECNPETAVYLMAIYTVYNVGLYKMNHEESTLVSRELATAIEDLKVLISDGYTLNHVMEICGGNDLEFLAKFADIDLKEVAIASRDDVNMHGWAAYIDKP